MNKEVCSILSEMDPRRVKRYINIFLCITKNLTKELDFFQVFGHYLQTRELSSDGYRLISLDCFKEYLVHEYVVKDMTDIYLNHMEKRKILG